MRVLPKLWADEHVSWEGSCFSMPERNVLPKPVQKPHPPMWVTVTSPGTELDAADRGLGCLGVAAAGYAEQERRTAEYYRRIEQCDPVGGMVDARGDHAELPLLPRGPRRPRPRSGMGMVGGFGLANSHLLWTREAYPTRAYQSLGNLAPEDRSDADRRPGRRVRHPRGHLRRRSRHHRRGARALGVDRASTGINFLLNALEIDPAAAGARQHAPLRARGHAALRAT